MAGGLVIPTGSINEHRSPENDQIHVPVDFSTASNNDIVTKDEEGNLLWEDRYLLPPTLGYVDGTAVPPTENLNDVYILDESLIGVNAAWDGASAYDWVRFNGTTWNAITPIEGYECYNAATDSKLFFNGTEWTSPVSSSFYFGDPSTNGTWRITTSGNNLVFQRRESGTYVTKETMTP